MIPLFLLASVALVAHGSDLADHLAAGDVLLQQSRSGQSAALRAATGSPWTHTGLAFDRGDGFEVLEAVQPVKWTPLSAWVARGEGGQVVVLRLREPFDAAAVRREAEAFVDRDYDRLFQWSDDRIYCSELVYKAYDRALGVHAGTLAPLSSFDLASPEVQALIEARTAGRFDPAEPVVAPASLLGDDDFTVVFSTDPAIRVPD